MKLHEILPALSELTPRELEIIENNIYDILIQSEQDRIREQVKLNKAYLHKCFYNLFSNSYYKIISEKGADEKQVTALVFGELPIFSFTGIETGYWTLKSFSVKSVKIEKLCDKKFFKEIEKEEWEKAFEKHVRGLREGS